MRRSAGRRMTVQDDAGPGQRFRSRRSVSWCPPDAVAVCQRVSLAGTRLGTDVTGPYWVFAVVTIEEGAIRYLGDGGEIAPPGRCFALFIPPWSIVQARLVSCRASTLAFASAAPLPTSAPASPVAWAWKGRVKPGGMAGVESALRAASGQVDLPRALAPSPGAERAKRLIEETFRETQTLAATAARLRTSPAALSRSFKKAYGMPPVEYRHRLRVVDAVFRLAAGNSILQVAGDVGFGEASSFYRRFRSLLCASPGTHAARRSRNAKTRAALAGDTAGRGRGGNRRTSRT
ncbi:MAG TPA: AraC family transcriptional regulator [Vicinamibacteria bacterium]|nr:AraC family transcriptional regulator [Vicinamibacteria bacterium]